MPALETENSSGHEQEFRLETRTYRGTLLVFLFGIFGIPKEFSGSGLLASLQDHIHLGLDLKGGTHLILQVQVNDAVNGDSDNAMERLKERLRTAQDQLHRDHQARPGQPSRSDRASRACRRSRASDLRSHRQRTPAEYDLNSGAENSWTFSMKPQALTELKNRAVAQAIETIRNRIDQLGVSEPVIQEHGLGQYQILVQLPGVDDPARVKEIMQSTAMLEIKQVAGRALFKRAGSPAGSNGGVLPPDAILLRGRSVAGAAGDEAGEQWYLVSRVSAVTGRDLRRCAALDAIENGQPSRGLHFDQ